MLSTLKNRKTTMSDRYMPPYHITPGILRGIERIGEALGNLRARSDSAIVPILRRGNRIKTIQASLAIEGNSLSLEQVTAVIADKRVLAPQREIQEVRNAFAAYEELPNWSAYSRADLLAAHGLMMAGLVDEIGCFRSGKVGIQRGEKVIHVAPPAKRVPATDGRSARLAGKDRMSILWSPVASSTTNSNLSIPSRTATAEWDASGRRSS